MASSRLHTLFSCRDFLGIISHSTNFHVTGGECYVSQGSSSTYYILPNILSLVSKVYLLLSLELSGTHYPVPYLPSQIIYILGSVTCNIHFLYKQYLSAFYILKITYNPNIEV